MHNDARSRYDLVIRTRQAVGTLVLAKSILGGLHHAYSLALKPMSA
jgi:hypothetical protein